MNELTKAVVAALVLASSPVLAQSDYPAADYQPKVLYTDPDYKQADSKADAVVEEKKVARQDTAVDPAFPATNFQPKVLYTDNSYKHTSEAPGKSVASKATATESAAAASNEVIQNEKQASSDLSYIGLIALALIGFVFFSKKSAGQVPRVSASDSAVSDSDSTGVEKYLEKMGANKTGVAKYLEKQTENPATGVAKYMAKQIVKDRESAAARATGVEKYLREKG